MNDKCEKLLKMLEMTGNSKNNIYDKVNKECYDKITNKEFYQENTMTKCYNLSYDEKGKPHFEKCYKYVNVNHIDDISKCNTFDKINGRIFFYQKTYKLMCCNGFWCNRFFTR
jgi:hypothetical protein